MLWPHAEFRGNGFPPPKPRSASRASRSTGYERLLYQEDGAVCLAERTVWAQARLARRAGVDVRERAEVIHIAVADDLITVETEAGAVSAETAVVAAGSWAGGLLSELAVDLPLRPTFAQVSYFAPRSGAADGGATDVHRVRPPGRRARLRRVLDPARRRRDRAEGRRRHARAHGRSGGEPVRRRRRPCSA